MPCRFSTSHTVRAVVVAMQAVASISFSSRISIGAFDFAVASGTSSAGHQYMLARHPVGGLANVGQRFWPNNAEPRNAEDRVDPVRATVCRVGKWS